MCWLASSQIESPPCRLSRDAGKYPFAEVSRGRKQDTPAFSRRQAGGGSYGRKPVQAGVHFPSRHEGCSTTYRRGDQIYRRGRAGPTTADASIDKLVTKRLRYGHRPRPTAKPRRIIFRRPRRFTVLRAQRLLSAHAAYSDYLGQVPARRRHRRIRASVCAQPQFHRPSIRLCLDVCGRAGKSDRVTGGKHAPRSVCAAPLLVRLYGRANYLLKTAPGGGALGPQNNIAVAECVRVPSLTRVRLCAARTN